MNRKIIMLLPMVGLYLSQAHAIPITTSEITQISPPASVVQNVTESNTEMFLFQERSQFVLSQDVDVQITTPTTVNGGNPPTGTTPGTIPALTTVSVFFLHHDTIGLGAQTRTGSITFEQNIIGVILNDNELDISDSVLGLPDVIYPTNAWARGTAELNSNPEDRVTLDVDLRTLSVTSAAGGFLDQLRVITEAPSSFKISPPSGDYVTTEFFDFTLIIQAQGVTASITNVTWNGNDVTASFTGCVTAGTVISGGETFRCPISGQLLGSNIANVSVTVTLSDGSILTDAVVWDVIANTEP